MPSACLRILLVEDDELFRLGLQVRLQQESGLQIAAEAEDGETAIELANQQPFDVVLMDVGLPGIGGIEACRQIKQQQPNLPVLVLTSHSQPSLINRLIEVGAQGYCLKGIAAEKLVLALRSVAAGASWWDQAATQQIRTAFDNQPASESPPARPIAPSLPGSVSSGSDDSTHFAPLTQREQQILSLLAMGKSNQEIATGLYISPGTVRVHVHAILHKLDVRDRTQAVVMALQKGLIT